MHQSLDNQSTNQNSEQNSSKKDNKRLRCHTGTTWCSVSVEIFSIAANYYYNTTVLQPL